jgi:flagellar basal body-associated protein FliL
MDMRQSPMIAIALVVVLLVASLATWAVCRWWYGKRLLVAAQRLHKSDQGRLFSQQQTLQAKKQIEALKKELAEHRAALCDSEVNRKRTRELELALAAAERAAENNSGLMPLGPSHGFADTQLMP